MNEQPSISNPIITFSTCWYRLHSKKPVQTYLKFIHTFLSQVEHFNLVIYTNIESLSNIQSIPGVENHPRIKIILREYSDFVLYPFDWIENHKQNYLKGRMDWKLTMIYNEKIFMVQDTIRNKYFDTKYHGWCDIGYFRSNENLKQWPKSEKILALNDNKIHYGLVGTNRQLQVVRNIILNRNDKGLPNEQLPTNQVSVAGGFFILSVDLIDWWANLFMERLKLYFQEQFTVHDDQRTLIDCILHHPEKFELYHRPNDWFMFYHLLNG